MEKNFRENRLVEDKLPRLFLHFVLPSVIAMVISGIQGMIDGIFLGNFVSSNAMASVNIANPYMQVIIGSTMVVCTGTLSFLGRTIGEKNQKKAKDIFKSSVMALLGISAGILAAGALFHRQIALLLGANQVLLEDASQYIGTIAFFAPAISFMILFGFIDRLMEKPYLYLAATVVCLAANITADYIAVKILGLGVRGAAAATGLSYLAGLLIVIGPMLSRKSMVNLFDGDFDGSLFRRAAFNGSSEGVTYLSTALTLFLFNRAFIGFAGETGVAAFTVINYIGNFVILIMFGISDGIGSIVSCNYGAGRLSRIRKTFYGAVSLNFLWGILLVIVLNRFSRELIGIFLKDDPEVLEMAVNGARIYALSFLFSGFNILQSGYHTSVGNALLSFCIAASRGILCISLGIALLPRIFGLDGVWMTLPFAELVTLFFCLFIMGRKKELFFRTAKEKAAAGS